MPVHSLSIYIHYGWFDEARVLPRSKIPFQLRVPEKPSLYLYQKGIVSLPNQKQEETQSPRGHMARRRRERGKSKHEGNLFGYAMPKEVTPVFDLYFYPPPSSTRLSQKDKASYEKAKPSTRDGPKKKGCRRNRPTPIKKFDVGYALYHEHIVPRCSHPRGHTP